jgi:hypothetical protein
MPGPSISEISAFLADLNAHRRTGSGDLGALMDRKASLLERIAATRPGDTEAAAIAANARANADRDRSQAVRPVLDLPRLRRGHRSRMTRCRAAGHHTPPGPGSTT